MQQKLHLLASLELVKEEADIPMEQREGTETNKQESPTT